MDDKLNEIEKAARLVAFGLDYKTVAINDLEYKDLIKTYKSDSAFQQCVQAIAAGFKLRVLSVEDYAIILGPGKDSIFTFKLADAGPEVKAQSKEIFGIALLGIAAYLFPKQTSFLGSSPSVAPRVSPKEIDEYIRGKCKSIIEKHGSQDAPATNLELLQKHQAYLNMPQVVSDSVKSMSTSTMQIKRTLDFLVTHGLARKADGDEYYILPRFQLLLKELSSNEEFINFLEEQLPAIEDGADAKD